MRLYASTTQSRSRVDASSSRTSDGRATFTIDVSTRIVNTARHSTASTSHRRRRGVGVGTTRGTGGEDMTGTLGSKLEIFKCKVQILKCDGRLMACARTG